MKVLGLFKVVPTIKQTATNCRSNREDYIGVTNTSAARQIKLAKSDHVSGYTLIIADESGGCGTNNITIIDEVGSLIDGQPSFVMDVNFSTYTFCWTGTAWVVK